MVIDDDNVYSKDSRIHKVSTDGGDIVGTDGRGGRIHPPRWDGYGNNIGDDKSLTLGAVILLYFGVKVLAHFESDFKDSLFFLSSETIE